MEALSSALGEEKKRLYSNRGFCFFAEREANSRGRKDGKRGRLHSEKRGRTPTSSDRRRRDQVRKLKEGMNDYPFLIEKEKRRMEGSVQGSVSTFIKKREV